MLVMVTDLLGKAMWSGRNLGFGCAELTALKNNTAAATLTNMTVTR
jgi:hypothetical protein